MLKREISMFITKKTPLILYSALSVTVISCGGGEQASTTESTVAPSTTPVVFTPPVVPITPDPITFTDLTSTPEFTFTSSTNIEVLLPTAPTGSINYFINICTDYVAQNGSVIINYNSCKLRTALSTSEQSFSLSLSNTESLLVAQVWAIEVSAKPLTLFWNIAESGNKWQIDI